MNSEGRKLLEKVHSQLEASRVEIDELLGEEQEKHPEADSTDALASFLNSLDECMEYLEEASQGA